MGKCFFLLEEAFFPSSDPSFMIKKVLMSVHSAAVWDGGTGSADIYIYNPIPVVEFARSSQQLHSGLQPGAWEKVGTGDRPRR